ncbi:unnamed protein product [Jaminaea pallidilutea]
MASSLFISRSSIAKSDRAKAGRPADRGVGRAAPPAEAAEAAKSHKTISSSISSGSDKDGGGSSTGYDGHAELNDGVRELNLGDCGRNKHTKIDKQAPSSYSSSSGFYQAHSDHTETAADVKRRLFAQEGDVGGASVDRRQGVSKSGSSDNSNNNNNTSASTSTSSINNRTQQCGPVSSRTRSSRIGAPLSTALSLSLQSSHFKSQGDIVRQRQALKALEQMTGLGQRLGEWAVVPKAAGAHADVASVGLEGGHQSPRYWQPSHCEDANHLVSIEESDDGSFTDDGDGSGVEVEMGQCSGSEDDDDEEEEGDGR